MTAIDYPNSPTVGQNFVSGGFQWTWDGQKWNAGSAIQPGTVYSVAGRTGNVVLTHTDITDWNTATPFLPLSGGTLTGNLTVPNLIINSFYLTFSGAAPTGVNTTGGPLIYGDGNWIVIKPGSGNQGFQVQDYAGVSRFTVGMGNTGLGINATAYPSDNFHIFSDGNAHIESSTQLWLNGNTGATVQCGGSLNASGNLYASGGISCPGEVAGTHSIATSGYLWVNGIQVTNNGSWFNISGNGPQCSNILIGGMQVWNDGAGRLYCNYSYRSPNLYSDGSVFIGGLQIYNNGGWTYFVNGIHTDTLYSRNNVQAANDIDCASVFRCTAVRGARLETFGGDWGWLTLQVAAGGYLYASPDNGSSGFNYTPNGSWSDARLKTNIRDSEVDALAAILSIPIRAYEWNDRGRQVMPHATDTPLGLIAQEVERAIPFVVHAPLTEDPNIGDLKMIEQQRLTPYLIRAIQQLEARVAELEAK